MKIIKEIPDNWQWVTLTEIGSWGSGGTPNRTNGDYYGGNIPWLKIGDLHDGYIVEAETSITDLGLSNSSAKIIPPGTLLVAMYGSIGKLGITRIECATNQAIAFCHVNEEIVDKRFALYYLRLARGELVELGQGGGQQNISQTILKAFPMPIAPLHEQRRIVEKLDTLFARLDKGEESVREVQKLLTRYRQSVLKSAVTGQLTTEWRAQREGVLEHGHDHFAAIQEARQTLWSGRYKKPVTAATSDMPDLPDHWTWASLASLIYNGPTNGTSPKASNTGEGVKSFKLTATTSGHFIIDENTIKVVGAVIEPDSKYWLKSGDVLVQRGNTIEYVGTAAIFPGPDNEYIYPDLMMRLRFTDELMARWAVAWINFEFAKRYFRKNATGTAGNMPKINGTTLKALAVPIPPRHEIEECMRLIDEAEAKHRPLEQFCETELKRSASLRQSILKDAFTGRLVPQDPNDEPASTLLARIASEKAPTKKPRRKVSA
ncbi:restriction endonuclease subunit S [Shimia biformata]|uniref:restriction endonuclease subunit S n=1 Tax=Shimia biformata TaxID=1294299 RepID=UPI00194E0FFD|nr:restriction endonuclease subunit S [Shimia biformata]